MLLLDCDCSMRKEETPVFSLKDVKLLCEDPMAHRLAYERCKLLDSGNTVDEFLNEACRFLFSDVMQVYAVERPGRKFLDRINRIVVGVLCGIIIT